MKDGVDVYQYSNINDEKQEQLKNLYLKGNILKIKNYQIFVFLKINISFTI